MNAHKAALGEECWEVGERVEFKIENAKYDPLAGLRVKFMQLSPSLTHTIYRPTGMQ